MHPYWSNSESLDEMLISLPLYWRDMHTKKEDNIYDWITQYICPWESSGDRIYEYIDHIYSNASCVSIHQFYRLRTSDLI